MPKLGLTMTEGTIARWLKREGEAVQTGDILFEFENDKSLMEFEAPAAGVMGRILVAEGETVPCGAPVAVLQSSKGAEAQGRSPHQPTIQPSLHPSSFRPHPSPTATPAAKRRARQLGVDLSAIAGRGPNGRIHVADVEAFQRSAVSGQPSVSGTPLARRMAREKGIDWTQLEGSGPGGRVVKADVLAAAEPSPQPAIQPETQPPNDPAIHPTPAYTAEPLSTLRQVIARRMSDSAFNAPHVTLFTEVDATNLVSARAQLNAELGGAVKISFNALLAALVARALREHPALNACLVDDEIRRYHDIHLALAVDTERGLLAPVIRHTDRLTLPEIQRSAEALIQRALAGHSQPDDLTGGTFTLTNLGMYEIDGFTPIINQPQAAILGVGRIAARAVVVDGQVVARQMMILSLSFDHRLVDGGPAARFLQRVRQLIERPMALLVGR